jgi:hypothetical protein
MSKLFSVQRAWLVSAGDVQSFGDPLFVSRRFVLFTVLVAANLFDVYITRLGIERGVLAEANPLMRVAVESFWVATAVKLATLGFVAVLLTTIRPRWRVMETVLASAIGWYVAILAWNLSLVVGV